LQPQRLVVAQVVQMALQLVHLVVLVVAEDVRWLLVALEQAVKVTLVVLVLVHLVLVTTMVAAAVELAQ
jgi:hypothetical protein